MDSLAYQRLVIQTKRRDETEPGFGDQECYVGLLYLQNAGLWLKILRSRSFSWPRQISVVTTNLDDKS